MKKSIMKIDGVQKLTKTSQKQISGGMVSDCISGCYRSYLSDVDGNFCAVPSPSGAICFGTIQDEQCCI